MEVSEINNLLSIFGSLGAGFTVGGGVVYLFIKSYLPSYFSEKAKNLASKEDIADITDRVESVKTGYAEVLEEIKSNHQIKVAAIEREKALKKEVYMEAIEAVTRSQNMISSFSNLNLTEESITTGFAQDAGKIAKVQIVGSKETVKAVTNFMAAIGTTLLELMRGRLPLVQRKWAIENLQKLKAVAQQEIDKHIGLMKSLNLEGNATPQLWDTINQNVAFEQSRVSDLQASLDELWTVQNAEHLVYARKCMDCFFNISELLPPIVLAVRNELELDISSEDYLDIFNANILKGKQTFDAFLNSLNIENV